MKKLLVLGLVVGLVAGSLGVAEAKKKRSKPTVLKYFLHFPAEGSTCGTPFMDLKDTPDSGCGFVAQPANEIFYQSGDPLLNEWPAAGGLPWKLDTKKPITAEFFLKSLTGSAAAGLVEFKFELSGAAGGKAVTLVNEARTVPMVPTPGGNKIAFSVPIAKNLAGKKFTALYATTMVHGVNTFHYISLDNPAAFITLPVIK